MRAQSERAAVHHVLDRGAQLAVIVIFERDEAERLQHAVSRLARGSQYLRHAAHRAGLGLESDFYKISVSQRLPHTQQSAGYGNRFELSFSVTSVFQPDRSQDCISKLDTGGTPRGVRLGEVSHKPTAQ